MTARAVSVFPAAVHEAQGTFTEQLLCASPRGRPWGHVGPANTSPVILLALYVPPGTRQAGLTVVESETPVSASTLT